MATKRRLIKHAAIVAVAAIIVAAVAAYRLAGSTPARYCPAALDYEQRQLAARQFYRHMMNIDDAAQMNQTFSVHLTERDLNRYLASADEIAALLPEGEPGKVQEMMHSAEFSGPAVAIEDGSIVFMARAGPGSRVVSIELEAWLDKRGLLHMDIGGMWIGRLPVPRAFAATALAQVRSRLLEKLTAQKRERDVPGAAEFGMASRAAEYAAGAVLAALDGQVVTPVARWRRRLVRLVGIEARKGELILYVAPEQ